VNRSQPARLVRKDSWQQTDGAGIDLLSTCGLLRAHFWQPDIHNARTRSGARRPAAPAESYTQRGFQDDPVEAEAGAPRHRSDRARAPAPGGRRRHRRQGSLQVEGQAGRERAEARHGPHPVRIPGARRPTARRPVQARSSRHSTVVSGRARIPGLTAAPRSKRAGPRNAPPSLSEHDRIVGRVRERRTHLETTSSQITAARQSKSWSPPNGRLGNTQSDEVVAGRTEHRDPEKQVPAPAIACDPLKHRLGEAVFAASNYEQKILRRRRVAQQVARWKAHPVATLTAETTKKLDGSVERSQTATE